jgi:nucleoid DNA-binding protein
MAKATKASASKKKVKTMTKSQLLAHIAEKTELSKKQVDLVLNTLIDTATDQLKSSGKFVFPGLARMTRTHVEAKKGGEKKINPLTKTEYITKDKPAFYRVKVNPIKAIKTALA